MPTTGDPAPAPASQAGVAPVAYFSMELALESHVPTYSGGLGVLAGDLLRALGHTNIARFHMNEGHSALLALELLNEQLVTAQPIGDAADAVARQCVFTTHTPVPAGHDQFPRELVLQILGAAETDRLKALGCCRPSLNMTLLALRLSHYVNGVTRRHGEIPSACAPSHGPSAGCRSCSRARRIRTMPKARGSSRPS